MNIARVVDIESQKIDASCGIKTTFGYNLASQKGCSSASLYRTQIQPEGNLAIVEHCYYKNPLTPNYNRPVKTEYINTVLNLLFKDQQRSTKVNIRNSKNPPFSQGIQNIQKVSSQIQYSTNI